jgi:hypothetical protein
MPFPVMKSGSGTVLGLYGLGSYTCVFIRDPESVWPIKYLFMLIVTVQGAKAPSVVITCEHNEMQSELLRTSAGLDEVTRKGMVDNAAPAYFCFFDQLGSHFIVEPFEQIPDADAFRIKALALAASKLGVIDAPVLLNSSSAKSEARMGKDKRHYLLFGGAITIVAGAVALYVFLQQPKNVDDCILKGMEGVVSDRAAIFIRNACQNKFPEPSNLIDLSNLKGNPFGDPLAEEKVPTPASAKSEGRARFEFYKELTDKP